MRPIIFLPTGHFALEEDGNVIAGYINHFLDKQVRRTGIAALVK